jgi:hypothetical protein
VIGMGQTSTCDECGGTDFHTANDSILQRLYPFIQKGGLRMCAKCGAKYVVCAKCGSLLTRVHLSLDVYGVRDTCPSCGQKNVEVAKWIAKGGGRPDYE